MGGGARAARGWPWMGESALLSGRSEKAGGGDLALSEDDGVKRPSFPVSSSRPSFAVSGMSILSLVLLCEHGGDESSIEGVSRVGS